jgi:Tol biopolymer transport system component
MTRLDLHDVVPEPPEALLDWPALDARIRRRRVTRHVTAAVGVAAMVTGTVALGVSVNHGSTQPPPTTTPTRHADGQILFTAKNPGSPSYLPLTSLYSANVDGGGRTQITHEPGGVDWVVASPDGRRIAYSEETYGHKPQERYVNGEYVHIANIDGTDDRKVYSCPNSACGELLWSPDSARLAIGGTAILQPDGRVVPLCIGSCAQQRITNEVSWSPDGRHIAYGDGVTVPLHNGQSGPGGYSTLGSIGVMNADGSDPKVLTNANCTADNLSACTQDSGPIWSPDGSSIAFVRAPVSFLRPNNAHGGPVFLGAPTQLATMHPDGTQPRTVWRCGRCGLVNLTWSPRSRQLAFVSDDYVDEGRRMLVNLRVLDVASGRMSSVPLPHAAHTLGYLAPSIVWSPSGTRLLLGGRGSGIPREVSVVSVTAGRLGRPQQVTSTGFAPIAWLPRR